MATYIAPISWGMGDLAVSLPVVQALIDDQIETHLVIRSELQSGLAARIIGLAGVILEQDFDASSLKPSDRFFNLRDHPLQRDFWWGSDQFSAAYPGYKINDCLKEISRDFGLTVDFQKLIPLKWTHRQESANAVIFIAGTDGTYKCWPQQKWMHLHRLLRESARKVILLGEPNQSSAVKELCDLGLPWIETSDLGQAIDLISSADAVVGVDTGLMHIAINQGVDTIALYRSDPIYIRQHAHAYAFIAEPCAPECVDASISCRNNTITEFSGWQPKTWHCSIDAASRCMASIDPQRVFATLSSCLTSSEASKV